MKIKTSELQGAALDWAVMQCEEFVEDVFEPSEYWGDGGPIIEREKISIALDEELDEDESWCAFTEKDTNVHFFYSGPTPLIAAMRCYVAMKLGDEVEVPEDLLEGE